MKNFRVILLLCLMVLGTIISVNAHDGITRVEPRNVILSSSSIETADETPAEETQKSQEDPPSEETQKTRGENAPSPLSFIPFVIAIGLLYKFVGSDTEAKSSPPLESIGSVKQIPDKETVKKSLEVTPKGIPIKQKESPQKETAKPDKEKIPSKGEKEPQTIEAPSTKEVRKEIPPPVTQESPVISDVLPVPPESDEPKYITDATEEILKIMEPHFAKGVTDLGREKEQFLVAIGESLNNQGGYKAMMKAFRKVKTQAEKRYKYNGSNRLLELIWDNIGDWPG